MAEIAHKKCLHGGGEHRKKLKTTDGNRFIRENLSFLLFSEFHFRSIDHIKPRIRTQYFRDVHSICCLVIFQQRRNNPR